MRIYNTLTRGKEEFKEITKGIVNMYVCGPTTYNYIHIGNARPLIVFDAFRKYLEYKGYVVNFVQNYTDIDDKIINKGKEEGIEPLEIANKYIKAFREDSKKIGVKEATFHPRVSENIPEIINMIEVLIKKGIAYESEGDVYFSVSDYPQYGKLAKKNLEELKSGARVEVGTKKKNSLDFALWKNVKKGEISWKSPWGYGRPGWHIECSAMSLKYLKTETLDIHGGGQDLIFPHHENEVAQSEGFTGVEFVKYWMHNGFITVNEEKMSKSLDNFFLVREVLERFSGEVLRYFILSSHYRSPIDFSDQALIESEKSLKKLDTIYKALLEMVDFNNKSDISEDLKDLNIKIDKALDDDFNTALLVGCFFELHKLLGKAMRGIGLSLEDRNIALGLFDNYLNKVMGILPLKENKESNIEGDQGAILKILVNIRNMARKDKNFVYADYIRDELNNINIEILDTKNGTKWQKK